MKKGKIIPKAERRETKMEHAKIISDALIDGANAAMNQLVLRHGGMTPNDLVSGISIATEIMLSQMARGYGPTNAEFIRADLLQGVANELLRYASLPRESDTVARD